MDDEAWGALDASDSASGAAVRWRVRTTRLPWWKRWVDRRLVQAEVTATDGRRYSVRIRRNLPLRDTPLGPVAPFVPNQVNLAVLIGANLYTRGRTGWTVEVLSAETPWRASHVIHTERVRGGSEVADTALRLAAAVQRGDRPWETDEPFDLKVRVRKLMNWE